MAELVNVELSPEKFDKALRGGLDDLPVLPDRGDLSVYFKPNATVSGKGAAVLTFTVQLPDGTFARVQTVTTAALVDMIGSAARGYISGGHL